MKGRIIKWDDEKGFGFIKSNETTENLFAHAANFVNKNLRPAVGDEVTFEIKQTSKGLQATKITYPNQPHRQLVIPKTSFKRYSSNNTSPFSSLFKLIVLVVVGFIGVQLYQNYKTKNELDELAKPVYSTENNMTSPNTSNPVNANANFKCDGRQYCTQMTSREEAKFFIKNCPNTKMDGDNDGEPCEGDRRW